jgi:hypothetical protein
MVSVVSTELQQDVLDTQQISMAGRKDRSREEAQSRKMMTLQMFSGGGKGV